MWERAERAHKLSSAPVLPAPPIHRLRNPISINNKLVLLRPVLVDAADDRAGDPRPRFRLGWINVDGQSFCLPRAEGKTDMYFVWPGGGAAAAAAAAKTNSPLPPSHLLKAGMTPGDPHRMASSSFRTGASEKLGCWQRRSMQFLPNAVFD